MPELQAAWIPHGRLFFWTTSDDLVSVSQEELPGLARVEGAVTHQSLAIPGEKIRRKRTQGVEVSVSEALRTLATVKRQDNLSLIHI